MSTETESLPNPNGKAHSQQDETCPIGPSDVLANRYSVELLIGAGTFGWVLAALDLVATPPRRVALKVLRRHHASHEEIVWRFERRELALLLRVHATSPSPHVVQALSTTILRHGDLPYLVLEFIDGPSLREVLDKGSLEPTEVRRMGAGIARGLAAIHSVGGVHRDIKPANIRLRGGTEPVIVDLGITRGLWETQEFTVPGQMPMTPRYASPEQLIGHEASPASDIYSLGVLLYEMLTGALPVSGNPSSDQLELQRGIGPSSPRALRRRFAQEGAEWIFRCMAQDPRRRPTALELEAVLSAPVRQRRSQALRWGFGLCGLLLLALWVGLILWPAPPPPPKPLMERGPPWSRRLGNADDLGCLTLASTTTGNMALSGCFWKTLDLGNGPLTSAGSHDIFVASFDPSGKLLWRGGYGDAAYQDNSSIALDQAGNIFVHGQLEGILNFGGQPLFTPGGPDTFLVKFAPDGHPLWSRRFGDVSDQQGTSITIDPNGFVIASGHFHGTVDFGGGPLTSAGRFDVFLAKFTPDGQWVWSQRFGDAQAQLATDVAVDQAGNIALCGRFEGSMELGSRTLTSTGPHDTFLAVFDAEGHPLWSKQLGIYWEQVPACGVRFDKANQLLVFDVTAYPIEATKPPADSQGPFALRVSSYTLDGKSLWSHQLGPLEQPFILGGDGTDPEGRILVGGTVQGRTDFGDGPLSGLGGSAIAVLELGPDGSLLRARRFGGTGQKSHLWSFIVNEAGNVLLAATFDGTVDLGSGPLTSDGGQDLFIAQLTPPVDSPPPDAGISRCSAPPSGLVAWYPLDEPEIGTTGPPSVGRLLQDARYSPGRIREAVLLNGGFFQAPEHTAPNFGRGDFSMSAWIRTMDAEGTKVILDQRREEDLKDPVSGYSLFLNRGWLAFQLSDGIGVGSCNVERKSSCTNYYSGQFVADGAWHLVTVTVKRGSPQGGTFYIDGVAAPPFDPTLHAGSIDNDGPLRIGSRSSSETGLFRGLIDEVALWNRVLSPEEVTGLYRAGSAGMCRAQSSTPPRSP